MTAVVDRITKTPNVCGGRACIAGHRVRVLDIVILHEQNGWTPDEIVSQAPSITLADVHAALDYYYDNREEIQEEIRAERAMAEQFRASVRKGLEQADRGDFIEEEEMDDRVRQMFGN